MKILHIVPSYWPAFERGGPIESVHALNEALVGHGIDVTVYTTDLNLAKLPTDSWGTPDDPSKNVDGVRVFYFPISEKIDRPGLFYRLMRNRGRGWQYSKELEDKLKELKKGDFDLIHITSTFLSASTLGAEYAKKNNIPYIISPRGNLMKEPLRHNFLKFLKKRLYLRLIERKSLADAAAIHFTSQKERQEYSEMNLPLRKSIVVGNLVNTLFISSNEPSDFRAEFEIPKEAPVVLSLGRINWKKGFDTLIPAWRLVAEQVPDAYLVIAGPDEGGYLSEVRKMIKKENLDEKRIIITGMLVGSYKLGAFRKSDIFVLPSYSENFGMAVAEAMYCKKPVIITPQVAISKMVERSGAGLIVPKTPEAFAEAIVKLINEKDLGRDMGEKGYELVRKEFSSGVIGGRMMAEYKKLI